MPIESGRIQFRKSCVSEINRFKRVNRTGFFSFYCMCAMLCLPFGHAARYHHYKLSGKRHKFYFMTTNRRSKFYLYALVCVCVLVWLFLPSLRWLLGVHLFVAWCCIHFAHSTRLGMEMVLNCIIVRLNRCSVWVCVAFVFSVLGCLFTFHLNASFSLSLHRETLGLDLILGCTSSFSLFSFISLLLVNHYVPSFDFNSNFSLLLYSLECHRWGKLLLSNR